MRVERQQSWTVPGLLAAAAVVATTWTGCSATPQTELVPGMLTQIQVPRDLKSIRIDIEPQGESSRCIIHSVDPSNPGFITLPRTLGVVPGGDPGRVVTITLTGYIAGDGDVPATQDCVTPPSTNGTYNPDVKVLRRSRLTYVGGQILFLPMSLRFACYDAANCAESQTCKAGQCVDALVDPTKLPAYRDDILSGTDNTCFGAKTCFADEQPAKVIDADTCTYSFSATPVAHGMNVRIFWDQDGGETEILDQDADEGFTVDSANAAVFHLAPGLCALTKASSMAKHKIYQVDVASVCPPKAELQPLCDADQLAATSASALPDGGVSTDGGCNVANPLSPAPSALYVLMDDSVDMAQAFGPQGVEQILGFSLSDPVFRNTSVAFKLLPHSMNDCNQATANSTATPDISFQLAKLAQPVVAAVVGNSANALMTDPKMFIDAALQANGAYKALRTFETTSMKAFNRLAVMILSNRPMSTSAATSDCGNAAGNAATEAGDAFASADSVSTYVVGLANPNQPGYDETEAKSISTSGHTTFFDASSPAAGLQAFNSIVSDLGSCLYELPAGIDTGATLGYFNPLALQQVSIAPNPGCSAMTLGADGWNIDKNRIRICGQSCTDLRTVLTNVATASFTMGSAAPDVPVSAIQACH